MKKTKLSKTGKSHTNAWYRKKCVEIAKMISKHRDNYTCVTCGRTAEQGWQMHGSHVFPEGRFARISAEPMNIICQCAKCHMEWHEHPLKAREWFDDKFPGLYNKISKMENLLGKEIIKPDYKQILVSLKEEYNKLINL
jgi:hypothetical protein